MLAHHPCSHPWCSALVRLISACSSARRPWTSRRIPSSLVLRNPVQALLDHGPVLAPVAIQQQVEAEVAEQHDAPRQQQRITDLHRERRTYVTPEDVQALAGPVLAHRVALTAQARYGGTAALDLVAGILATVEVPT